MYRSVSLALPLPPRGRKGREQRDWVSPGNNIRDQLTRSRVPSVGRFPEISPLLWMGAANDANPPSVFACDDGIPTPARRAPSSRGCIRCIRAHTFNEAALVLPCIYSCCNWRRGVRSIAGRTGADATKQLSVRSRTSNGVLLYHWWYIRESVSSSCEENRTSAGLQHVRHRRIAVFPHCEHFPCRSHAVHVVHPRASFSTKSREVDNTRHGRFFRPCFTR